jgi:3D-(3,5/4)-trihydroxycyclohexane-1,2-dione acylhydrolase (decyclizing)
VKTWLANTPVEIRAALAEARDEKVSCMIVVSTERYRSPPGSDVWWEVIGAEVTNDPMTRDLVLEREKGRKKQRFYY